MCNLPITEAIHRGIYNANLDYEQWSRGYRWLNDSGSEGLMVAGIARALHEQRQGRYESLHSEKPFQAAPGRVDIALLNENKQPIYVIEAKRFWEKKKCKKDLDRIGTLVENQDGLRGGVAAVLVAQKNGAAHGRRLEQAMYDVNGWDTQHPNVKVNICVSKSWGYPMCWRFDHDYPRWQDWQNWQNWKGASICVEIVPA